MRPGLRNVVERYVTVATSRRIFQKALGLLAEYVATKEVWDHEARSRHPVAGYAGTCSWRGRAEPVCGYAS